MLGNVVILCCVLCLFDYRKINRVSVSFVVYMLSVVYLSGSLCVAECVSYLTVFLYFIYAQYVVGSSPSSTQVSVAYFSSFVHFANTHMLLLRF